MKSKKLIPLILSLLIISVLLVACGKTSAPIAKDDEKPVHLSFATMGVGTGWYTMGNAFTQVILPYLPAGSTIDLTTDSVGGVAAAYMINEKATDMTLGIAYAVNMATNTGVLGRPPVDDVMAIAGGFEAPVSLIVFTESFIKRSGITSVEEIVVKKYPVKMAIKSSGAFGEMVARMVLEELGVTYDDIKAWGGDVIHTTSSNVIDMLRDGRADITIDHTQVGQANYMELSMTGDVRFIEMGEELLNKFSKRGFSNQIIPKGSFNNLIVEDMKTVGSPTSIIVHKSMSEDIAYLITKALCENKDALVRSYATLEAFEPETAWELAKTGAPLHPGAVRYYKEKRYMN